MALRTDIAKSIQEIEDMMGDRMDFTESDMDKLQDKLAVRFPEGHARAEWEKALAIHVRQQEANPPQRKRVEVAHKWRPRKDDGSIGGSLLGAARRMLAERGERDAGVTGKGGGRIIIAKSNCE